MFIFILPACFNKLQLKNTYTPKQIKERVKNQKEYEFRK